MWRYWLDWMLAPSVALAIGILTYSGPWWMAGAAAGVVLFGLVEYLVHRFVLHGGFYHHSNHERHHTHPNERVVFPWWYTPSIFAAFSLVLPYSVFTGMLIGYGHFLWWHHALHFWDLEKHPIIRRYARWHMVHHAGFPNNFGISHPLFDLIFGTYRRAS